MLETGEGLLQLPLSSSLKPLMLLRSEITLSLELVASEVSSELLLLRLLLLLLLSFMLLLRCCCSYRSARTSSDAADPAAKSAPSAGTELKKSLVWPECWLSGNFHQLNCGNGLQNCTLTSQNADGRRP